MWQKCPICNGTGKDPQYLDKYCTVCQGARIISELTGLPPVKTSGFHKIETPKLNNLENPK